MLDVSILIMEHLKKRKKSENLIPGPDSSQEDPSDGYNEAEELPEVSNSLG